jgi:hypothetical protein
MLALRVTAFPLNHEGYRSRNYFNGNQGSCSRDRRDGRESRRNDKVFDLRGMKSPLSEQKGPESTRRCFNNDSWHDEELTPLPQSGGDSRMP